MFEEHPPLAGQSPIASRPLRNENSKGQAYSAKEVQLIKELVQARKEQQCELEYETFEGYEIPPRTQFSMLNKPAVSIKYGKFTFNMACIRLFEGVQHILTPVSEGKKRLAVICCSEEESSSVEWARLKKGAWVNKTITSIDLCENIFSMMDWNRDCRYKVLGRIANSERGIILLFDFPEAIMFAPSPEEYVDEQTGEIKKRRVVYYPDKYKGRIGRSYSEYAASQQMSLFEMLDDYGTKTYGDAPTTTAENETATGSFL